MAMTMHAFQKAATGSARIACVLALFALSAGARQIAFSTAPGALSGTQPVSVEAIFDFSPTSVMITVTNYSNNPVDVTQGLSGLAFQPTGQGMTIIQPKLSSSSGSDIDIYSGGTHSTPVQVSTTSWGLSTSSNPGGLPLQVCRLCNPHADELLLGDWDTNGLYSNANGSIAGNPPHNPFLYRTATFTVTGINSATSINSVIFAFGTSAGQNVPGYYVPDDFSVPEPQSLALACAGLLLGALSRVSRRRRRAAPHATIE